MPMPRQPEPELMLDPEQARAYADADFEQPHSEFVRAFRARFNASWVPDGRPARVLDLGCGPADISIRFARAFPGVVIDGVDGAEAMLAPGRERLARATELAARVRLHRCRLPDEALPGVGYDAVISNSLLHHLHDPSVLWQTLWRAATPGAPVFVMDLMRPDDEATARRLVGLHAAGEPEVLQRDFYHSLLAAFRPGELSEQLVEAGLVEALRIEPLSDRHLVVFGHMPTPARA